MIKKLILLFFCFFFCISYVKASDNLIKTDTNDKIIFIQDQNGSFGYSWSFDKKAYNNFKEEFSLDIDFTSDKEDKIDKIAGKNVPKEYISFDYHGDLPANTSVKVPTSKFKDTDKLYLYYYNDKTKKIEYVDSNIMVKNGYVTLNIKHCSDYFLTKAVVKDAEGNENSLGIVIVGMIIAIVALIGFTMFKNQK